MIIDTKKDFDLLHTKTKQYPFLFFPIYEQGKKFHISNSTVMCGCFYFGHDQTFYLVNKTHPDAVPFEFYFLLNTDQMIFVNSKREHLYKFEQRQVTDILSLQYVNNKELIYLDEFETFSHKHYKHMFRNAGGEIGKIIPIVKWHEMGKNYSEAVWDTTTLPMERDYAFYSYLVVPTLQEIETAGLFVDIEKLHARFPSADSYNNFVYTEYYPFTTTGRPSNAFGGINYAALNKSDGSREIFISRFGDSGCLLNFDFDAYHIRLLANHLNIPIDESSVHTYLAKQYYQTNDITEEMYAESKQLTFAILYGRGQDLTDAPELLRVIKKYENELWELYQNNGHIKAPLSGRKIYVPDASPSKVFNYFTQALESETTISKLCKLHRRLRGFRSKIVLFVYDSILMDCLEEELEAIEDIVREVLEDGGFPVKVSKGANYNEI